MNAQEARKAAEEAKLKTIENASKDVMKKIGDSVKKGQTDVWYYGNLNPEAREELTALGYSIQCINDRNETDYLIKW